MTTPLPSTSAAQQDPPTALPTVGDLLRSRPGPAPGPAEHGWRGQVRRLSLGLIRPQPGPAESAHRAAAAEVRRSLSGPKTVVVINPKGGAHKTTTTLLLAATFGRERGGYTLAWDNNETRGTLGWRAQPAAHTRTATDLLADLDKFATATRGRVGDLDHYVRPQRGAHFDVLASDEDAAAAATIDALAFDRLHATLSRFYRVLVVDTGNNMRAPNWGAAVDAADQLVIVSTVREDTAATAAWLVDGLRARGREDKVAQAVTLLAAPDARPAEPSLRSRLHDHFGQLTRTVVDVPYDRALASGAPIDVDRLQRSTREAWLYAAAAVAAGL
jgi:MinD-like ATPase involved in chromosome partitioning or flagellar assembly